MARHENILAKVGPRVIWVNKGVAAGSAINEAHLPEDQRFIGTDFERVQQSYKGIQAEEQGERFKLYEGHVISGICQEYCCRIGIDGEAVLNKRTSIISSSPSSPSPSLTTTKATLILST